MFEDLFYEEIHSTKNDEWQIAFDGSSTNRGGGAKIVLYTSDGTMFLFQT